MLSRCVLLLAVSTTLNLAGCSDSGSTATGDRTNGATPTANVDPASDVQPAEQPGFTPQRAGLQERANGTTPAGASPEILAASDVKVTTTPPADWPFWRGPNHDGKMPADQVPLSWSDSKNVVWKTPVPGRGHASPTVVGERIFLATADERAKTQSVVCYDRSNGLELWSQELHRGGFDESCHQKNTQASSTIASDGEQVYAVFLTGGNIVATALDLQGNQVWQRTVGEFKSRFGYSASPALYKSTVLVAADNWGQGQGYLAALDRKSGEIVWQADRPTASSYASPVVFNVGGRDRLLIAGAQQVAAYNPATGDRLWSTPGVAEACVGTVVVHNNLVFASGGYPQNETLCVRADTGDVVWRNSQKAYVPSMLIHERHLFQVSDDGRAFCWNAETGAERWKSRIGGNFSASPVLAGGHIFASDEQGKTTVFKANPEKFEVVGTNQLGQEAFATPTICGNRLYLRVAERKVGRQEMLYCIGAGG